MRFVRWATATTRRKVISGTAAVLAVAIAVPAVWLAWWLISPLFENVTVDEEFPLTVGASIPAEVTREEAETMMELSAKLQMAMDEQMTPAMRDAAALSTGEFEDEDFFHKGSGQATIYRLAIGGHVLRLENLSVTNGPDLHVLLLQDPEARNKNLGYIDLGGLKGNRGNQNYEIPDGADVSLYNGVMIYCQPFHVVFSTAKLSAAGGA